MGETLTDKKNKRGGTRKGIRGRKGAAFGQLAETQGEGRSQAAFGSLTGRTRRDGQRETDAERKAEQLLGSVRGERGNAEKREVREDASEESSKLFSLSVKSFQTYILFLF